MARKPQDYEAELAKLGDRTKKIKEARITQFGDLVCSTGAENLSFEVLAGLLLHGAAAAKKDPKQLEVWEGLGRAYFQRKTLPAKPVIKLVASTASDRENSDSSAGTAT